MRPKSLNYCLPLLALGLAFLVQDVAGIIDLSITDLFNFGNKNNTNNNQRSADKGKLKCGYSSCPPTDPNKINVHIIAHSHDDVGWLKTVDQYYYGLNKRNNMVGVRHILSSVVPQLVMDPSKRFIYVEMSFFSKWWDDQDEPMRNIVRRLVNEGRLEFINGGWCMNDEATVSYQSTIEQMTLGLKFLNETFGVCGHPKTGWQIDPFGHTSEQASLFAQFGFDSMFVARIDYADKRRRTANKSLDIVWHADRALPGPSGSIYTNVMHDGYDAPQGFCFDAQCFDDEIVDNKNSYEYNIDDKALQLIDLFKDHAASKLTNDIMVPFGGDFQFMAAEQNFLNIDKLIKYIRVIAPEINIFYSTPSCYAHAVHQHSKKKALKLPTKYDDFIPYDSSPTVWWSGYFVSRPSVKLIEREVADLLQLSRLISFGALVERSKAEPFGFKWSEDARHHEERCLAPLWTILGDLQHHDAITGTEKQHVADDYVRRASDAINQCSKFIGGLRREQIRYQMQSSSLFSKLRAAQNNKYNLHPVFLGDTSFCQDLNISQCAPLEANVNFYRYVELYPTPKLNQFPLSMPADKKPIGQSENATNDAGRAATPTPPSKKPGSEFPPELETRAVLMHVYNPYGQKVSQHDFRLPCMGICDLAKVRVIHLATNASLQLIRLPVPAGVANLPFRDATTTYEMLFYSDLLPFGYTSFIIEDLNTDEIIEEEPDYKPVSQNASLAEVELRKETKAAVRSKRIKREQEEEEEQYHLEPQFSYFTMESGDVKESDPMGKQRTRRQSSLSQQGEADKIVVKFDLNAGMIVGLKRVSDGSVLNITQKFGYYFPANAPPYAGAYIFRPNSSEPQILEKPSFYKMFKRKNGALVEIHQKWNDWIWQTIRVDSKKNYIEFDYVIGPIPTENHYGLAVGREVVTRYITDMKTDGVFMTDSNGRQLLVRKSNARLVPEELGGSLYPVVSTIMLRNTKDQEGCTKCKAEAISVLVDRPQAGTSPQDGKLELLVHRRLLRDDNFGVSEALDEPGEDGRGLVTRGKHRLYLKFPKNASSSATKVKPSSRPKVFKLAETNPKSAASIKDSKEVENSNKVPVDDASSIFIVHDQVLNDLSQESRKYALRPILTFDRLRVTSDQFIEMFSSQSDATTFAEQSLLNSSLPNNIHLLTFQPWPEAENKLLLRLENLDNPLTVHTQPNHDAYKAILSSYAKSSDYKDMSRANPCDIGLFPRTSLDIEYLFHGVRIVSVEELNLGANVKLQDDKRLNFTDEPNKLDDCQTEEAPTSISLTPRQIRTFFATFEPLLSE